MKKILSNDLIKQDEFVREIVDDECDRLYDIESSKIILNGGRGTGKSTLLTRNTERELGRVNNQTILMKFDAAGFIKEPNETFNENFFKHYYELLFAKKLVEYIKVNYPLLYKAKFLEINQEIINYLNLTDDYINNILYKDIQLKTLFKTNEIVPNIIEKIKNELNINYLNLAIDRFDWINNSSITSQKILENYFNHFYKTILSIDDETIKVNNLANNYYLMSISYCYNIDAIKEIIFRRIDNNFPIELLTDDIYDYLIKQTKGNISLMFSIINEWILDYKWDSKNYNVDLSVVNQEITHNEAIRKIGSLPKFHL